MQSIFQQKKAQVSLEYMLLLCAFFAMLAFVLPVMIDSTNSFLSSSDVVLAKRIADEVNEEVSLFSFLADGSSKSFEYFPAKSIIVYSRKTSIVFEANGKEFLSDFASTQFFPKKEFSSKLSFILKKEGGKVLFEIN
jgi:hypothetical protein